jgi:hypothetical protein
VVTVREKSKSPVGCAVVLILGLIAFCLYLGSNSPPRPSSPAKHGTVTAGIRTGALTISIANEDIKDWPALEVFLNGMPPFTYHLTISPLKVGQKATYNLNDFAKDNGERFSPLARKVTEAWIGGNGFDYMKYGF